MSRQNINTPVHKQHVFTRAIYFSPPAKIKVFRHHMARFAYSDIEFGF